ncbi:hypothetical protein JCM33374_g5072 [Metschnikowia sp. JCM 33374]|nr:hypothetical protein JCM33374_g5072 [Metschnikowia sp. JCM 33374]
MCPVLATRGWNKAFGNSLSECLTPRNPHVLSDAEQSHKILHFLNENSICGYNNIINKPSKRLISGSDQLVDQHTQRVGSMKLRLTYLRETLLRLFQLVKWALVEVLYYWPKNKLFGKKSTNKAAQEESTQEFETRRRHAPAFIRHLLSRNVPGNEDVLVASMEYMNDTGVESPSETSQYLIEEDDSPDFELLEEIGEDSEAESEVESDVELIDFTVHTPRSREANPTSTGVFISPITELMTPDNFIELFQHKEILHHHLQYEYSERGMMTRSRYRALSGEQIPKDQTAELIDLILAKRRAEGQKEAKKSTVQTEVDDIDGIDDLDPRIACVICQTEPRTLITWPCKCFAICEGCRVSLVAKGMQGCVCCRQDVEGVSRVFLP